MKISNETKVGILTISALTLLILGFNFLKGKDVFKKSKKIYAVFSDLGTLEKSNEVKINGLPIGSVYDKIELDKQSFDIVQLINEILNALSIQFEQHQAIIEFQPSQQPILVYADKLHLSSVIFNLLDNAIKYSKNQPTIFVTAQQLDGRIEIK